jgi:Fe(3+) dicitrate transport protein
VRRFNRTPNAVITSSNLNGKRVENAPRYIHNLGLSWEKQHINYVAIPLNRKIFDANNTTTASANG